MSSAGSPTSTGYSPPTAVQLARHLTYIILSIMTANPPNPAPAQLQPGVYPAVYSGTGVSNCLSDVLAVLRAVYVCPCIPATFLTPSLLGDARPPLVGPAPSRSVPHNTAKPAHSTPARTQTISWHSYTAVWYRFNVIAAFGREPSPILVALAPVSQTRSGCVHSTI